jgi:hypothetical protein
MAGSPEFQTFITTLEPVRKEFESFLLGGRALYGEDRKAANVILSDNSAPSQIQAALKQMGHTATARYTETNYRYKKLMGHDIPEPFSPEAIQGAHSIGVDLKSLAGGGGKTPSPKPNSVVVEGHEFPNQAAADAFSKELAAQRGAK